MTVPRASVVIRCHNEERHIDRLLSGVFQQTVRDVEVILVDSGSTDGTLSVASRYPVKILTIRPEVFSFGRSLNRGCREARADVIVIASAHTYPVYNDWLEQLLAPFTDARVGLTYGRQRGDDRTKYSERQIFARWFPEESNGDQPHPFCNNANAAIRRELWTALPYDEDLTGLEDLDWARRAAGQGHRIVYVAEAEVVHVHDETWAQIYTRYRREAIAFKHIFPEERLRLWDAVRLFAGHVANDLSQAAHDGVLHRQLGGIPLFRLMQFAGTYRGFAHRGPIDRTLRATFYYPARRAASSNGAGRRGHAIDYARSMTEDRTR